MRLLPFFATAALLLASSGGLTDPALPQTEDTLQPAAFNAVERAYILGQMRLFLESIQAINEGLAADHLEDVAEAAAARGLKRNADDPNFPKSINFHASPLWKQLGGGVRRGFDELSDAAKNGAPKEKQLGILAETMKNCVACHQTYRLVHAPEP
jgi:hypothetical protein